MKTYIFFDTNTLEIPDNKIYLKFSFSSNYDKTNKIILDLGLKSKVIPVVPKLVVNELFEHYKRGYISDRDAFINQVNVINRKFKGLLKNIVEFDIKSNYREYVDEINESVNNYFIENSVLVAECKNDIAPFIDRALAKKEPFKKSGKYNDAGFKDVVIWETIKQFNLEKDDLIILFAKDNDFSYNSLCGDLSCKFHLSRTVENIKEVLIEYYKLDLDIIEYEKYIISDYFNNQMEDLVNNTWLNEYNQYKLLKIDLNTVAITKVKYRDLPDAHLNRNDEEECIEIDTMFDVNYMNTKNGKKMILPMRAFLYFDNKDIFLDMYEDQYDFNEGTITEGN